MVNMKQNVTILLRANTPQKSIGAGQKKNCYKKSPDKLRCVFNIWIKFPRLLSGWHGICCSNQAAKGEQKPMDLTLPKALW